MSKKQFCRICHKAIRGPRMVHRVCAEKKRKEAEALGNTDKMDAALGKAEKELKKGLDAKVRHVSAEEYLREKGDRE